MNILRSMFTGRDGVTHDIGRYLGALFGVAGVFFQGWDLIVNHVAFNFQSFGIGCGSLAAGVGALLKLKQDTEPRGITQ